MTGKCWDARLFLTQKPKNPLTGWVRVLKLIPLTYLPDEPMIPDSKETKPEDWDDAPATIVDPEAKKPEDWDDDMDGEWEAPKIPNPEFKGEWKPKV